MAPTLICPPRTVFPRRWGQLIGNCLFKLGERKARRVAVFLEEYARNGKVFPRADHGFKILKIDPGSSSLALLNPTQVH